jgi:23S rRNA pseudouridine2604 synthase
MSSDRPKLTVAHHAATRNPKRGPVRPGAPRPAPSAHAAQAKRPLPAAKHTAPDVTHPAPEPPASPAAPAEGIRLSKHLADSGQASRREADEWIEAGWVKVDGQVAVLGQRVLPHQRIDIDPAAHRQQARRVTILLHKPIGYVSGQAEDGYEPASVLVTPANHWRGDPARIPFHPGHTRGLAPAGRLDIDSTGLLVLTQDGRIAKLLIGDDSHIEKEYLVRVQPMVPGPVPDDALRRLHHGLSLDGKPLKPAKVSWQNEDQLRFVLREGRKRQIRRMCEAVGLKVLGLKRVRIGQVVLGKLPPGQWRYLGEHERF